ncbi:MAG: alpha-glucan family phosphorylase [Oligoflexia bacterium]|nr:alpha-glucan family phosphorylase [Oligoflexia bacterium]
MKIHSFTVLPTTPQKLKPLLDIANNLWFSWNWDARQLFAKLDVKAWKNAGKNPLRTICDVSQQKLEEAARNKQYVAELEAVYSSFKKYLASKTWFDDQYGKRDKEQPLVAYFSAEYGLHESLPIYSGGLGVLSGDHLKSASDLGIPLIAIGIFYRQGYFRQSLDANGMQQEHYPENDWFTMPATQIKNNEGHPLILSMDIGGEEIFYQIWLVKVGRLDLYLLDTNLPMNSPSNKDITKRLYDSDRDMRIRQEIILGIGGIKALRALNIHPSVFHINEGHSAFLVLERLVHLMEEEKLDYNEAKEVVWATNLFTTHTPVPEGNERFHPNLVKKYLYNYAAQLKMTWNDFLALGRENRDNEDEEFCMTILGLNFSSMANGVSKLHGSISRQMWCNLYADIPVEEIPLGHVTNGVHTLTWISKWLEGLFIRYMQTAYVREIADFTFWKVVEEIPPAELWYAHLERKKGLIKFIREQVAIQRLKRGATASEVNKAEEILDPYALTIGFARRFAPYKRGDLIFRDVERLIKILTNEERPVQLVIAGKAHPADTSGKSIIKKIFDICNRPDLCRRIVFIEDYDLNVARYLVQGVDVWLNTPRRPMEASGTSGMKAAMNGILNISILDGWWDEAFDGNNGWAIGHGETYNNHSYQDEVEANLLYRLIENEVAPLYYERDEQNIPTRWVSMVKESIHICGENFNAHNMLTKYLQQYYTKGEQLHQILRENNYAWARQLANWRKNLKANWKEIKIVDVTIKSKETIHSGDELIVSAQINLGVITPTDVIVEVFYGLLNPHNKIEEPHRIKMQVDRTEGGITIFNTKISCNYGGRYGYLVRILPGHPHLAVEFIPELIKWEA